MLDKRMPLFKIASNIFESITLEDIDKTAKDMELVGLLQAPYDIFRIQVKLNLVIDLIIRAAPVGQIEQDDVERSRMPRAEVVFEYKWVGGNDVELLMYSSSDGVNFNIIGEDFFNEKNNEWTEWCGFTLCRILVVLLATKNIKKDVQTCNKPNSRNRRERTLSKYSSVTTISIGKITETMRSNGGNGGPVRPHLRRGHIRNQRVGVGRTETKQIFIQPMFINADQGWIDSQKEYRVVA